MYRSGTCMCGIMAMEVVFVIKYSLDMTSYVVYVFWIQYFGVRKSQ